MSALAQWMVADGWTVRGTDQIRSEMTDELGRAGMKIDYASPSVLPGEVSLLVYSDAVPSDHSLRVTARAAGVREVSYAELLGELTEADRVIAIAGSHGKSTTTAIVGLILEAVGCDPTVVIGTRVPQWRHSIRRGASVPPRGGEAHSGRATHHGDFRRAAGSLIGNFRHGLSNVAVVEADEYRSHFLTLTPEIAVVTTVDHDHVDSFPTAESYQGAFMRFVERVEGKGPVVLAAQDPFTVRLRPKVSTACAVVTFAVSERKDAADVVATPPVVQKLRQVFGLSVRGSDWGIFTLTQPGEHVVRNAVAAVAATLTFGVSPDVVRRVLTEFRGTWRRFEAVGEINGAPVITDYAHHPTELRALAAAARQWYPQRRLVIAFQPHQHARARAFAEQFVEALAAFDVVILSEVHAVTGREESERVTTKDWVSALSARVPSVVYAPTLDAVETAIRAVACAHDTVVVAGAGSIDDVARRFSNK